MLKNEKLPVLGFIGTGTINAALVRAFCRSEGPACPIIVSPRNAEKAAALQKEFSDRVRVASSMQQVANEADHVFVAVLPQAVREVYSSIRFRPDASIIDLHPMISIDQVRAWTGVRGEVAHIIPLAFVADVWGPMALYPGDAAIRPLLESISQVVVTDGSDQTGAGQIITSLEAPFFTLMDRLVDWSAEHGWSREAACSYVTAFFRAMCDQAAAGGPDRLHELADEFTPGGYNWRVKCHLEKNQGFAMWIDAMEPLLDEVLSGLHSPLSTPLE